MPAAADPPDVPDAAPGRYIVTLSGSPIATYAGGVKGLKATRPTAGRKVNARSTSAKAYRAHLEREQDKAAARVGAKADRHYAVALNGFATAMTPAQAKRLAKAPGVLSVVKDVPRRLTDDRNPVDFLRLSGPNGVWQSLGGAAKAGAGTVVGVLDSGYWPESPSFAGAALGTTPPTAADPYRPYKVGNQIRMNKADGTTFTGVCQPGAAAAGDFDGTECNQKVIGARWFADAYRANTPDAEEDEFLSPRDDDGHGSHTASTAAGNAGVTATADGRNFGKISGVAPAAKIAVYKVCYTQGCFNSDSLSAIDAAITDGVDVINFSISGSDLLLDPTNVAFLSAAAAGIFVSASAGNDGPGASTLNHNAPWLTTVAASTVAPYAGTVVLGNGTRKYAGITTTVTKDVGPAPLVAAGRVRRAGVSVARSSICDAITLDSAKVAGRIVVCDRGVVDRVAKSDEVKRAGGVGMVLVNLTESSRDADLHAVPTVHLNVPQSLTVREYALSAGATATLKKGNLTSIPIAYPQIAGFSSRGPSVGNGGDLLKPDISAPGVAVMAAFSPVPRRRNFDFLSGTSMSAPHIAGAAALYLGKHPKWSPMAVKSAMMTTAARVRNADGSLSRDYFAQGAGNVRPTEMFNPGLVVESGVGDWLSFIEGAGAAELDEVEAIDPSDYNAPSIAIGRLVGTQTVTRKVTAVKPGLYRTSVAVPGVDARVSPSLLTFTRPGQTKTVKVTFARRSAPLSQAAFGSLALQSTGATVRLPIAVTPQAVDAPATVTGSGASGSVSFAVKAGFAGAFPITARGLAAADVRQGAVSATTPPNDFDVLATTVPTGTRVVRWDVAADVASADIDMDVYRVADGALVGSSDGSTGQEGVTLFNPQPGAYEVVVSPFSDPTGQTSTTYEYRGFTVGPDLPNLSVSPGNPTVTSGQTFILTASWTGLEPTRPYLGYIEYPGGDGTFVEIDN
jgi:subtilisin family serine protease